MDYSTGKRADAPKIEPKSKTKRVKAWAIVWDDAVLAGGWGGGAFATFPFRWQVDYANKFYGCSKIVPCTITYNIKEK